MKGVEIPAYKEAIALIEHFLSLFGLIFTFYFNSNHEILFLCFMNMGQHLLKIIRILFLGFALENVPPTSCYIHAFINQFTMFTSLSAACLLIFTLYGAIVHPNFFSKYYVRYRPYTYGFIMIYTSLHVLIGLYEPIFKGYPEDHIYKFQNCGCGLRYRFYQYLFGSVAFTLPFTVPAVYCSIVIIYKIFSVPRKSIKKQITTNTKMSFTRWVKILCYSILITLLSFANLYQDIRNGLSAEKGVHNEDDNLGFVYYFTASSGVLIFLFSNSRNQIKKKLGYKVKHDESVIDESGITNNASSSSSVYKKSNISLVGGPTGKYNINNTRTYATSPTYFNTSTPIGIDNVQIPYNQGSPNIYGNGQYYENGSNAAYGGSNAAYGGSNAAYGGSNAIYGGGSNAIYGDSLDASYNNSAYAYANVSPLAYQTSQGQLKNIY